jgi:tripartite-type tricarboxylate transporter receptor subunit TctC
VSIQRRHFSLGLPSLLLATAGARAQGAAEYPNRPVRILMPSPAGAPSDITVRIVANALSQRWSHPVVVENRAGGAGRIAYEAAARSVPDGYTLVQTASNLTTLPFLHANLTFDPERDLVPVTQLITNVAVLVAQPSMGVKTLPEFVNWSKANKGKVNYGSPGVGNIVHMTIEMINASAGTDMVHVPFPGVPQYIQAFLRGDLHLIYIPYAQAAQYGDKMQVISVIGDNRLSEIPNVPTLKETGWFDYVPTSWIGLAAPGGTPKDIVDKIARDTTGVLRTPDVVEQIRKTSGALIVGTTPLEHAQLVQAEFKLWGGLSKRLGLKPQ